MQREEFYLRSSDNQTTIHGICWEPKGAAVAVLQLSHGMMEHIGRYDHFACWMAKQGVAVIGQIGRAHV